MNLRTTESGAGRTLPSVGVARRTQLVLLVPLLAAGALLVSALFSTFTFASSYRSLLQDQGDRIGTLVHLLASRSLHPSQAPVEREARAQEVLSAIASDGAVALALYSPRGELLAATTDDLRSIATFPGDAPAVQPLGDGIVRFVQRTHPHEPPSGGPDAAGPGAVRPGPPGPVDAPGPPRPPEGGFGPPGPPPGPGGSGRRPGPPPPLGLIIDFRPDVAAALQRNLWVTLTIELGAAGVLLVAAWLARQQLQKRDALLARLASEQHLASLGVMAATLAHEIRNPLASLKGHAQLLREFSTPGTREHERAELMVHETQRLERLVRGLLDFVKSGRSDRRPSAIVPLLQETAAEFAGMDVQVDLADAPPMWICDEQQIRQVVRNLLDNARQALPAAGPVRLRAAQVGSHLVVEVRDAGPGVPASLAASIFEPFVSDRVHGTGLGLAISRQLVRSHGGELELVASDGPGACFRFWLPES